MSGKIKQTKAGPAELPEEELETVQGGLLPVGGVDSENDPDPDDCLLPVGGRLVRPKRLRRFNFTLPKV